MARKKRKQPAKAPSIQPAPRPTGARVLGQTPQAPAPPPDPARPDPDQPPIEGPTGRPSVHSEWINSPTRRSSPKSAWLNSSLSEPLSPFPPPGATARGTGAPAFPRSTRAPETAAPATPDAMAAVNEPHPANTRLAGARQDMPSPVRNARGAAAEGDAPSAPAGRRRRTTAAKRLEAGDLLDVDLDALAPARPRASMAPGGVPVDEALERPTRVLPATPRAQAEYARRETDGRSPGAPGETAGRLPAALPRSMAGRLPGTRRDTASGLPIAREDTAHGLLATRRESAARLAAVARARPDLLAELPRDLAAQSVLIRGTRNPRPSGRIVPRRLRPPSIVMQAFVSLMTIIVLLGALMVTSPLGYGAAVSGTFQAYTTAIKWVPTPTPTATPVPPPQFADVPSSPGTQAIINEIKTVFGSYSTGALNIAHCESGFDPLARNPYPVGNSHAEGVFQILFPSTWATTSFAAQNPYNADANIHAAWEIFSRDGHTWVEWECKSY